MVEITMTISSAYLTFFIAEYWLHVSGVLSVVGLGVYLNLERDKFSPEVDHFLHEFWEMTSFLGKTLKYCLTIRTFYSKISKIIFKN